MPAFVGNQCRVYFNFSDFHDIDASQISMQVIVNNQKTNISELDSRQYSQQIMAKTIYDADEGTKQHELNQHYIIINSSDLQGGFEHGQYYRVQMRFVFADDITNQSYVTSGTISEHLDEYSEWSTVCLIKQIIEPELRINSKLPNSSVTVTVQSYLIAGQLFFNDADDESAKSYQIVLEKEVSGNYSVIETSGIYYFNKYDTSNTYSYKLKTRLQDNCNYKVIVKYITRNLYEAEGTLYFETAFESSPDALPTFTVEPDRDNDVVKITVTPADTSLVNFVILRSSSLDNFATAEEVYLAAVQATPLIWIDKTVESNVYYKYAVQLAALNGDRYQETQFSTSVLLDMEDVYLSDNDRQLKITLGNQVSGFKYNIQETKTDTLGSKYPIIRRNGHSNYRSFSINGTIAYIGNNEQGDLIKPYRDLEESDFDPITGDQIKSPICIVDSYDKNGLFETKQTLMYYNLYEQDNINNGINDMNNIYLERRFREEVMNFLYAPQVRLYRSATEGNLLVRLMNVTLSPKNELGKFIYDFSCEAIEIAEPTIENYNTYNIQNLGNLIGSGELLYQYGTIIYRQGEIGADPPEPEEEGEPL